MVFNFNKLLARKSKLLSNYLKQIEFLLFFNYQAFWKISLALIIKQYIFREKIYLYKIKQLLFLFIFIYLKDFWI